MATQRYGSLDRIALGVGEIPKDAFVVTACDKGGGRSDSAAAQLRSMGFSSVRPLCGGTQAWLQLNPQGA
jgi:rhodanese-related sulfurtransferase